MRMWQVARCDFLPPCTLIKTCVRACVSVLGQRNKKKDARTAAATSATDGENEQEDSEPTDDVANDNDVDDGQ